MAFSALYKIFPWLSIYYNYFSIFFSRKKFSCYYHLMPLLKTQFDNEDKIEQLFQRVVSEWSDWVDVAKSNSQNRFCDWLSSADEKDFINGDFRPLPFDGASDSKPFEIDDICNTLTAFKIHALDSAEIIATPVNHNNLPAANLTANFLAWYLRTRMAKYRPQWKLASQISEECGLSVIGAYWNPVVVAKSIPVSLDEFSSAGQSFFDFKNVQAFESLILSKYPDAFKDSVRAAAKAIIEDGEKIAQISVLDYSGSHVAIKAFRPGVNIYFPYNCESISDADYLFTVEYLSEAQLKAKVLSDDWSEDFVNLAIQQAKGDKSANDFQPIEIKNRTSVTLSEDDSEAVEVVTAYRAFVDDNGMRKYKYTVFSPKVTENGNLLPALDAELGIYPPRLPFVAVRREIVNERIALVRGAGEIAESMQDVIKNAQDDRVNRGAYSVCPPIKMKANTILDRWGPGCKLVLRNLNDVEYMQLPNVDAYTQTMEDDVRRRAWSYFGLDDKGGSAAIAKRQQCVDDWLFAAARVLTEIYLLHKQFGNDVEYFKIAGYNEVSEYVRAEDTLDFDFCLEFKIPNPESGASQTDILLKCADLAAKYDRDNTFKWGDFMREALKAQSPSLADKLLFTPQSAQNRDFKYVQDLIVQISNGMDVDIDPNINPDLAERVLDEYFKGSESIPAVDVQNRYQTDQLFRARIDKLRREISMIKSQQQNAIIGRLGAQPGNMTVSGPAGMLGGAL